jgi:metallo-beta-lactamase family protein
MRLTFHGGAGSVTGSCYLLESGKTKILIDCGLHQGSNFSEKQNYEAFPFDPSGIAGVFVTHGHIDHIGRIPQLIRAGFRGSVYSTPPTKEFAEFLLLDSEHLLREEAEKKKRPVIYSVADVEKAMAVWRGVPYHEPVSIGDFSIEFFDAGHVLGSSSILVSAEGKRVVFSGDLGNMPEPLIKPTEYFDRADYALIESTYGNRIHERLDERRDLLEDAIEDTVKSKGVLMIPAFALERTQELLFELNELVENGRIPRIPIFIDSPLAIKLTAIYQKYSEDPLYFNKASLDLVHSGDSIFNFPGLRLTLTTEESKAINDVPTPKVIVAGAGMSNGGRILHHERRYLSDPKSAIIFIGYQGAGSLGRQILENAESVRMFGETVPVRCRKYTISGYSAHADQPQLLKWLDPMRLSLRRVFVVQGEPEESEGLAQKIRDELALDTDIPSPGQTVVL